MKITHTAWWRLSNPDLERSDKYSNKVEENAQIKSHLRYGEMDGDNAQTQVYRDMSAFGMILGYSYSTLNTAS